MMKLTQPPAAVDANEAKPRLSPHWPAGVVTSEPDLCPSELPAPPPTPLRRQGGGGQDKFEDKFQ